MEGSGWEKSRAMPGGAQTAQAAAAPGTDCSWAALNHAPLLNPFSFPGKMSAFSSSAELEISLILHVKGNPSYNRVSIVEGIKSKKSLTQQHRGAHSAAKGTASGTTGNRIYSVVEAGCQNPARQPRGEERWAKVRL